MIKIKKEDSFELVLGVHILIKKYVKSGKRLVTKKFNIRTDKIIGTITLNYEGGIYSIIIEENYANYFKDEELIVSYNQIALIDNNEWNIIF